MRLLVVDDPPLARAVAREWSAHSGGEVEIENTTTGQILAARRRPAADAIIYPSSLLGELAERGWIAPLPGEGRNHPQLDAADLFDLIRLRETAWGGQTYAVSFGSPQLVVYYRADLFESLGVRPPESWAEYQTLAALLDRRDRLGENAPPQDAPWCGVVEPLADGWAGQVLLARAAAYANFPGHLSTLWNYKTMQPLIDGEPFVRALAELAEAARSGPEDAAGLTPEMVRRRFLEGKCGMAIAWPSAAAPDSGSIDSAGVATGFAELPGSTDVYNFRTGNWQRRAEGENTRVTLLAVAGRLGSVASRARGPRAALELLAWTSGRRWSGRVAPYSTATTLYRRSHLAAPLRWVEPGTSAAAAGHYAEIVERAQNRRAWFFSVRVPGRAEYMAALDEAVRKVVRDGQPPQQALDTAAARWRKITDRLGKDRQRRAYWHSLGIEP